MGLARRAPAAPSLLVAIALAVAACGSPSTSPAASDAAGASAPPSASAAPSGLAETTGPCGGRAIADPPWWNDRVFYEVFVRSFQDSDGDGIGDLRRPDRAARLPQRRRSGDDRRPGRDRHLADARDRVTRAITATTSPTTRPSRRDYGTREDFDAFLAAAHERGISVIVDLVLNHTSVEHPWFVDARIPGSEHDGWYEWSATEPGVTKPGGGRVWHRAGSRFYYSYFWEGMADLNLANPDVTTELDDIARFWLEDVGVDGFRMDAIKHLFEEGSALEELPATHAWLEGYQDRMEAYKPDTLLVGEVYSDSSLSAGYVPDDVDLTFDFGFAEAVVGGAFAGGVRTVAAGPRGLAGRSTRPASARCS